MQKRQIRHPHNGVHRRADIMRHAGKKIRFGAAGLVGGFQRRFQFHGLMFQLGLHLPQFCFIGDIQVDDQIDRQAVFYADLFSVNLQPGIGAALPPHLGCKMNRQTVAESFTVSLQLLGAAGNIFYKQRIILVLPAVFTKKIKKLPIRVQKLQLQIGANLIFGNKTRQIIIRNGLFHPHLHHFVDVVHNGIGDLNTADLFIDKGGGQLNPNIAAVLAAHPGDRGIAGLAS